LKINLARSIITGFDFAGSTGVTGVSLEPAFLLRLGLRKGLKVANWWPALEFFFRGIYLNRKKACDVDRQRLSLIQAAIMSMFS